MYRNFIFDMGNVLMDFSPDYILSRYTSDVTQIERFKRILFGSVWQQLDNGDISFEEAKNALIKKVQPEEATLLSTIIDTWHLHKVPRQDMLEIVKELKGQGYGIYLCSNAAKRFYEYMNNYEVFDYFNDIVISADIQISKPDLGIYMHVLTKNNLNPEECLFIDDINANIEGARKCGIAGYHYNGNAALFREFLVAIGIIS